MSEPTFKLTPSNQNQPWYKKKKVMIPLGLLLFVGIMSNSESASDTGTNPLSNSVQSTSESTESPTPEAIVTNSPQVETNVSPTPEVTVSTSAQEDKYGIYPSSQAKFIKIIEQARDAIEAAENDLQESVALRNRDIALCKVLSNRSASNWVGLITNIGANGEGKAYVEIELAEDVRVKTWNNSFSDMGDSTLISPSASFFNDLVLISEDSKVLWSGKFLSGSDLCLKQANMTEYFYGIDPQFIVKFSNVKSN